MPGGAGTLDEMFETMTLIQTGKLRNFPIVLMGKEYWKPLMDMIDRMVDEGMISPEDPDLIFFTDDVEDAADHIERHAVRQFALRRKIIPSSMSVLGEKTLVK
jgi:predicted Rossmann-fold nucleotide-binding protein